MQKSDVNGDNTSEVYKYLKEQKSGLLGLTRIKVRVRDFILCSPMANLHDVLVEL